MTVLAVVPQHASQRNNVHHEPRSSHPKSPTQISHIARSVAHQEERDGLVVELAQRMTNQDSSLALHLLTATPVSRVAVRTQSRTRDLTSNLEEQSPYRNSAAEVICLLKAPEDGPSNPESHLPQFRRSPKLRYHHGKVFRHQAHKDRHHGVEHPPTKPA
ncbi:hypothetical protein BAUCODRAFT_518086 [Baudoinia panamericana UAMH 10762]|uniref:Uncharacterized protein n=1 Tax=Baudoinia panamericana (strain UAMH 10762) TaxID=717646 RepID=M2MHP2_BAUPA|nr:uncharacterized protein BAUCODRAFT_518086 [Baudoinia panamericana UAMH 10762]EMC96126.1 hypothetical protein BAUCODRAFT_518086 [Baudoinia panamericana UAMH 10762]